MDREVPITPEQDEKPAIEWLRLKKGKSWNIVTKEFVVVFVLKGSVEFSYGKVSLCLNKGYAWLVPSGMELLVKANETTHLIVVHMHMDGLYEGLPLKMDYYKDVDFSHMKQDSDVLEIKQGLWAFLGTLREYIKEGIATPSFLKHKRTELGFLLDAYYSKSELLWFLRALVTEDTNFMAMVFSNYYKAKTVTELAILCGYSISGFQKRFNKIFGVFPGKWMKAQKAKIIYHEIKFGKQPIKSIWLDYGFSSPSHFIEYCKTHFGMTPGKLRKQA